MLVVRSTNIFEAVHPPPPTCLIRVPHRPPLQRKTRTYAFSMFWRCTISNAVGLDEWAKKGMEETALAGFVPCMASAVKYGADSVSKKFSAEL